ncbi:MAG: hypothetical protein IPP69_00125 [Flavobacteriales bacterium]|nr:hypothetical protein [Flavobacteriales bacterium]
MSNIFDDLKKTMSNLENTTSTINKSLNNHSLDKIFANVESITTNLKNNNESLSLAIKNAAMITDSLAKLNLAGTLKKVDDALLGINKMTAEINNGTGSLGKLIKTDSLHTEVVNASRSLDLLLNDMRINPKRYVSFSMFGKSEDKSEFSKKELEVMREEIDKALKAKTEKGE